MAYMVREGFRDYRKALIGIETIGEIASMRRPKVPWGQLQTPLHPTEMRIATQTAQEYDARPRLFIADQGYVGVFKQQEIHQRTANDREYVP
jgi:hypothetical protein